MNKTYDLILWGASGFTGALTARYIHKHYGRHLKWAIAGRSRSKLETIQQSLKTEHEQVPDICIGDAQNQDDMNALAQKAKVICSTVGPYALYGSHLVASCVNFKADYVDLTGESLWIREMIEAHHEKAQQNRVRIVHCCGFDSIPSDLGVFLLQEEAKESLGHPLAEVTLYVGATKGGFSGGTIASMMYMMEEIKDPKKRRILGHPYALNPKNERHGPDKGDQMGLRYDPLLPGWTAPFIMAGINTRVVRRTQALLGQPYGEGFSYREVMSLPKGIKGWFMGVGVTSFLSMFMIGAAFSWTRNLLLKPLLPKPGEGPSKEKRESGYFTIYIKGKGAHVKVKGFQDPGYGATSLMLAESALCLLLDRENLNEQFGVLTPASAMGRALIKRLRDAGMVFSFHAD